MYVLKMFLKGVMSGSGQMYTGEGVKDVKFRRTFDCRTKFGYSFSHCARLQPCTS